MSAALYWLAQHFVVILPQHRGWRVDPRPIVGELERRQRHGERAVHARRSAIETMQHAAQPRLRIRRRLSHCPYPRRGNVTLLQIILPLRRGAGRHDLFQQCLLARAIRVAFVVGALDHLGVLQHRPQPLLLTQIRCPQHHQPVLRLVSAVGRMRLLVAMRLRVLAVAQIAGEVRGLQGIITLHPASPPCRCAGPRRCARAGEQSGRQRKGAHRAGSVIDHRRTNLDRMNLRRAGHRHHARRRLDHVIIGRLRAPRPTLAERRERRIDQPWIEFPKVFITQAQSIERAGPVVLHQHVGGAHQLAQNLAPSIALQVNDVIDRLFDAWVRNPVPICAWFSALSLPEPRL